MAPPPPPPPPFLSFFFFLSLSLFLSFFFLLFLFNKDEHYHDPQLDKQKQGLSSPLSPFRLTLPYPLPTTRPPPPLPSQPLLTRWDRGCWRQRSDGDSKQGRGDLWGAAFKDRHRFDVARIAHLFAGVVAARVEKRHLHEAIVYFRRC